MGYFSIMGTIIIGNYIVISHNAVATVQWLSETYLFVLYFIFSASPKTIEVIMLKFSGIPTYNCNLSPSIKSINPCQLIHFHRC